MLQGTPAKRRLGRPRRLTLEQVIDAATEIGLARLDMVSVAQKLGIGVATLYGYVEDRDHLLQLVAVRLANGSPVEDRGQSWEDALREHARMVHDSYLTWPQLLSQQIDGVVGFLVDSPNTDILLRLLLDRGLTPADAMNIYQSINAAVAGAALSAIVMARWSEDCGGEEAMLRKLRAACEEHDYAALGRCLDAAGVGSIAQDYLPAVEDAIRRQQKRMGTGQPAG